MEKLTKKQELFCYEYIKDFNGSKAAIRAVTLRNHRATSLLKTWQNHTFKNLLKKFQVIYLKALVFAQNALSMKL